MEIVNNDGKRRGLRNAPAPDLCLLPHPGGGRPCDAGPPGGQGGHQGHSSEASGGRHPFPPRSPGPAGGETFAEKAWEEEFLRSLPFIREDDFLGALDYTRTRYGAKGQLPAPEELELVLREKEGRRFLFALNYRPTAQTLTLHRPATLLYTGETQEGAVTLPPFGTAVYELTLRY